jgi:hypothetical protein
VTRFGAVMPSWPPTRCRARLKRHTCWASVAGPRARLAGGLALGGGAPWFAAPHRAREVCSDDTHLRGVAAASVGHGGTHPCGETHRSRSARHGSIDRWWSTRRRTTTFVAALRRLRPPLHPRRSASWRS